MVWNENTGKKVSSKRRRGGRGRKGRPSELTLKVASAYLTTVKPLASTEVSARGGIGVRKG